MKKILTKIAVILMYLLFLLYMTGFEWRKMFDFKSLCSVAIGMCLLSLPAWLRAPEKKLRPETLSWNALFAAYIAAAVFLLQRLGAGIAPEHVTEEIAAGCRPILYGLLFYVMFHREEDEKKEPSCEEKEEARSHTAEELCGIFREKGLTAREAEVARLLYLNYTNKMIASELYISEATVKKHVTHILEKLELQSRTEIRDRL